MRGLRPTDLLRERPIEELRLDRFSVKKDEDEACKSSFSRCLEERRLPFLLELRPRSLRRRFFSSLDLDRLRVFFDVERLRVFFDDVDRLRVFFDDVERLRVFFFKDLERLR